jgi:hypothetical protein
LYVLSTFFCVIEDAAYRVASACAAAAAAATVASKGQVAKAHMQVCVLQDFRSMACGPSSYIPPQDGKAYHSIVSFTSLAANGMLALVHSLFC